MRRPRRPTESKFSVLQEESGSQLYILSDAVPQTYNNLTDSYQFLERRRVLNVSLEQENELNQVNTQQLPETLHFHTNALTDGVLP